MKRITRTLLLILLAIFLAACNMPSAEKTATQSPEELQTSVALTVTAHAAQNGQGAAPSDTPEPGVETSPTLTFTPTSEPTITPSPTLEPTATNTPIPCNQAKFVEDVTIPDGTDFNPGDSFVKTWRLRNTGSCNWSSGYDIVFSSGDAMGAPSAVQLTTDIIPPDGTVDVSVTLTAPADPGTYRGNWKLRDAADQVFGIQSTDEFWVEIEVLAPTDTPDPQTETLHRDPARSKTTSIGGASSDTRLGIAPNGDPLRAFVDFDLSALAGVSASSTIQSANLDLSVFTGNSCFEFLHPLLAYQIDYGANPVYPADFNAAPIATLLSVSSGAGISSPVDITSHLQTFVASQGASHFQLRMELEHDDSGSAFACIMEWPDPLLNVTYIP